MIGLQPKGALSVVKLGDLVEQILQVVILDLVLQRRDQRLGLVGVLAAERACEVSALVS